MAGGSAFAQTPDPPMFADGDAYERYMGRWSRLIAPQFLDFAGVLDGAYVFDVGCGTGSLAETIAGQRPRCRVLGIDPSGEYIARANVRNRSARVRFEIGDAQRLSFSDGMFDAALSLLVFNFIPDPRKALSEIRRVTRSGGRVAAAVWDYGEGMQMLRVFWDAAVALDPGAEQADEKHMPLCRAGQLRDLWIQAGLHRVEERSVETTTRFTSFDDYWDPFLLGQGPAGAYVKRLAPDRRAALREAVKRRLRLTTGNTSFALRARVWAVRGDVP